MAIRYYFISVITAVVLNSPALADPGDTLARMQAELTCQVYGANSDVCASAKRDFSTGSSSNETLARMQAKLTCQVYGEGSEICSSAKRDIADAIGRDRQYSKPEWSEPIGRNQVDRKPSSSLSQQENNGNMITFLNSSGKPAFVKIRGITNTQTFVADGASSTVNVSSGTYNIVVRYGSSPPYTYSQGDSFYVSETPSSYSNTTITLHKVSHGNYGSKWISQETFDNR